MSHAAPVTLRPLAPPPAALAAAALAAIVLAGCGGGTSATTSTAPRVQTVPMPAVVGLAQRDALRRFAGIRLTVYVYPERNPRIPRGVVFHQSPGPGPVPEGRPVAIYVSNGPRGPRVGRPFVAHR